MIKIIKSLMVASFFSLLGLPTLLLPTAEAANQHALNRIVAVVNEEVITESEFNQALGEATQQYQQSKIPLPEPRTFKKQILDQLIDQKLMLQIAARTHITVSKQELSEALNRIATQNKITVAILEQKIKEEGFSFDVFKKRIEKQLLISKVQKQAVGNALQVNKAEIIAFRKAHHAPAEKTEYHLATLLVSVPDNATPQQIQAAKNKAEELLKEARQKNDFESLMTAYPGSADLGWRKLNDLPQLFIASAQNMKVQEISGPVRAPNGFHILKLLDKRSPDASNLTDEQIQAILLQQKFENALRPWLLKLRQSAYIKIQVAP